MDADLSIFDHFPVNLIWLVKDMYLNVVVGCYRTMDESWNLSVLMLLS